MLNLKLGQGGGLSHLRVRVPGAWPLLKLNSLNVALVKILLICHLVLAHVGFPHPRHVAATEAPHVDLPPLRDPDVGGGRGRV